MPTTRSSLSVARIRPLSLRTTMIASVSVALLTLAGCTSAPEVTATPTPATSSTENPSVSEPSGGSASVSPTSTPSQSNPASDSLTINITIAHGKVDPNGKKIDVKVGQTIVLNVTSDQDDEVHAHTGGNGYELQVSPGKPVSGKFTIDAPGSYEVESHHLGKTIVILNAR